MDSSLARDRVRLLSQTPNVSGEALVALAGRSPIVADLAVQQQCSPQLFQAGNEAMLIPGIHDASRALRTKCISAFADDVQLRILKENFVYSYT